MKRIPLTILTTTDIHSTLLPKYHSLVPQAYLGTKTGGAAKRQTLLKQLRSKYSNESILLFDNGDFSGGSLFYDKYLGQCDVELFNLMKYSAITIGNHDPNAGFNNLIQQLQRLEGIPVLCSNLLNKEDGSLLFQRFHIFDIEDYKIGVFGIFGKDSLKFSIPEFQEKVTLIDPLESFREVANQLRETCNLIICLSHSHPDEDKVFNELSLVDILIKGHYHHLYKERAIPTPEDFNPLIHKTIQLHGPSHGTGIGIIKLALDRLEDGTFKFDYLDSGLEMVHSNLLDDDEINNWLQPYLEPLRDQFTQKLATCSVNYLLRNPNLMKSGINTELGQLMGHFISTIVGTKVGLFDLDDIKESLYFDEVITFNKVCEILIGQKKIKRYEIKGIFLKVILTDILRIVTQPNDILNKYQYYGLTKKSESNEYQIEGEDINDELLYPIAIVDHMWNKILKYSSIEQYLNDKELNTLFYDTTTEDYYWQESFANYLKNLNNLTDELIESINIKRV